MAAKVEFEDFSFKLKEEITDTLLNALEAVGAEVSSQAAKNTRVSSGETKRAWSYIVESTDTGASVTIGNPLENAIWEEFGTGEYALEGNGRKGGWYILADDAPELAKYNMKVVYGKDGKKFYYTEGKKPTRALYNAFNTKKSWIEDAIAGALKELGD